MKRVLVLRPEPGASKTAELARERGLDPDVRPLFEIAPLAWKAPEPGGFDGLLLTSANALRFAGDKLETLRGLRVYTVGAATAEAARDVGFDVASTGDAGVERLLGSIEPDLKLLHLAGEDHKVPADARQEITRVTVYRATTVEDVDLSDAQDRVAMLHSPRAARRFSELVGSRRNRIAIAAISAETAHAAGDGWAAAEIAATPTDEGLLAVVERLCNNVQAT